MIKTWQQRCEEHPDHDGIVSDRMIQARMQEEIDDLRAALEQTQEPIGHADLGMSNIYIFSALEPRGIPVGRTPLYAAPRQWQGLTDEDREDILRWIEWKEIGSQPVAPQKLIAYVERKLREKNP